MFCVKCGHPMDDGNEFCANCGAAAEKNVIAENEFESPMVSQPNDPAPEKTTNLLLLIGAGVVVLAAIVALVLNFGALKNWFVRAASSPEDLMAVAYKTAAAQTLAPVMENYSSSLDAIQKSEFASSSQIELKPGQQILDMLAYAVYGGEGDMSWLSDIRLDVDYILNSNLQKNVLGIGLGEHHMASIELTTDTENKKQYLAVPELNEQALLMDMTESMPADMTKFYEAMPSGETVAKLLERYMEILLDGFSNVEKSGETLSLGTISQEVTVLEAYMDHVDIIETMIAMLEQLKLDEDVKSILEAWGPLYNDMMEQSMSSYYDYSETEYEAQDLYADFVAQIDASLAQLQEELANADPENHLYLYTYLNDDNSVIGVKLTVSGMEETVSSLTLTQDGQFISQAHFGVLQIDGTGTEGDSLTGSYTVSIEGEKQLDIKLENVTQTSGTLYLEPSAALLAGIADEMGIPSDVVSMADVVLRISAEGTAQNSECTVSVLANEVSLLEIRICGEMIQTQQITLPADAVDSNDEEASFNWLMGLDVEGIMEKLQAAGVPEELFAALMMSAY